MCTKALKIGLILAVCIGMQQVTLGQSPEQKLRALGFVANPPETVDQGEREVNDDPRTLSGFRKPEFIGRSFDFRITGSTEGTIYGTDVYTDDSHLSTAAVHAGIIEPGQTAIVRVTILPERNSYRSMELNGITSHSYGPWPGSYLVDSVDDSEQVDASDEAPGRMSEIEGEIGQSFEYEVTGSRDGSVWGVDVYTDDSAIAAAAVHAGVIEVGETGIVKVTLLPARSFYNGLNRNGVTTRSYGAFRRSYMVDRTGVSNELEVRTRFIE